MKQLNWKPAYTVDSLIREMVDADMAIVRADEHLRKGGFRIFQFNE